MDASARPAKKSKFSVAPFGTQHESPPPELSDPPAAMTASGIIHRNDSLLLKKNNSEIKGIASLLSGLEEIKEDCVESKSDLFLESPKADLQEISDSVLENKELNSHARCWKSAYRDSKQVDKAPVKSSAFEACEEYFNNRENTPRQNFRKSNWTSNIPTRVSRFERHDTSKPSGQDVYQLVRSMQSKLETLKQVITKQKSRLDSPCPSSPLSPISREGSSFSSSSRYSRFLRS